MRIYVLVTCATLAFVSSAHAQRLTLDDSPPGPPRVDISATGGWLLSSDWSDTVLLGSVSPVTGALEQVLVRDLVVDPGPVYDGTVTYWEGRYGFRAHAGYGKSCLAVGRSCGNLAAITPGESGTVKVKQYSYDIGGAIGFLSYDDDRWVWPYAFGGIGGVTYDLDRTVGPPLTFIQGQPSVPGGPVVSHGPSTLLISLEELGVESRIAFHLGFGTDFRIPLGSAGLGVRVELSDSMHESPLDVEVVALDAFRRSDAELDFGIVHNLRAALGVVVQFGR
jgi:opacity protein-like surface antigen